jgi:predicted nucleotidyltransferase
MITLSICLDKLRKNFHGLQRDFAVSKMSVFGSVARNENKSSSDIDVLVSFQKTPSIFLLEELKQNLYEILKVRVDLIVDDELELSFRNRIMKEGVEV